jgi:hypothetical protein
LTEAFLSYNLISERGITTFAARRQYQGYWTRDQELGTRMSPRLRNTIQRSHYFIAGKIDGFYMHVLIQTMLWVSPHDAKGESVRHHKWALRKA